MTRIATPATVSDAPAASQPFLDLVKKQLGVVPNLFRVVSNSPAALQGYLDLSAGLGKGSLPAATRERIALSVAEINGCTYCLSAHNYLGKGHSNDPKADAAVHFAAEVTKARGHVRDEDLRAVKMAGYDDAQVVEIVLHVALNTWTNYINSVAQTLIDFPVAKALAA